MPLLPLLSLLAACEPAAPPVPLAEQDPTAQLAAIEAALAQDPQEALRRCAEVTAPPARQRCERIQTRPHLWQRPPEAAATAEGLPTRLRTIAPATAPCQGHAQPRACWSQLAYGHAAAGRPDEAAAACAAIPDGIPREECMFQAAEAGVERRGRAAYPAALELCGAAGRFAQDCLEHATSLLAEAHAPATPTAVRAAWAPLMDDTTAVRDAWAPVDPRRGAGEVDRLWAAALALVYTDAPVVTGAPLDALPPEAAPHVRAAAAWRLLQLARPADAEALLAERLADRSEVAASEQRPRRALPALTPLGTARAPGDGERVSSWLGLDQRLTAEDEAQDIRLCLEAARRHLAP